MDPLGEQLTSALSRLGKYEVIARLGKGGMAQIHLGVARGLGGFHKLVVLKRLESSDDGFRQMFLDEARLAALLHHPNVVNTYEVSENEGSYFIAMEYLEGQSLDRIIREMKKQGRALEPPFCARVIADALSGLHYTHELCDLTGEPLNVVHRDISPHNLLLTYDGTVKVLDFGVAKTAAGVAETAVGVLKGKLAYMAPEQAAAEPVDRRADIFSVGAVLWELLTLERLRTRESPAGVLNEAIYGSLPDLATKRPGIDRSFETVLWRALAKNPRRRYQTAQEMRDALVDYLAVHPCSQEDLADFMQARFSELRARTQRQISECLRNAEAQDPVISVTSEEYGRPLLDLALPRELPILDSGSLSIGPDDQTTPLAPGALSPSTHPPPVVDSSGMARSRSITFDEGSSLSEGKPRLFLVAALLAAAGLVWFWLQRPTSGQATAASTKPYGDPATAQPPETLLRLHGSNTIGQELAPRLVEAFLKKKGFSGLEQSTTEEHSRIRGRDADGKPRQIEIAARGSSTAFTDLAAGACDVGLSSRRVKPEEALALERAGRGDVQSPAGEHVLGLDGIAVIVHPNSRLQQLDLRDVQRAFTGEVKDFVAIGGSPGAVHLYARDDRSGTFDTFKHLCLGDRALAAGATRFADSAELSGAVARDPLGIGFIGIAYVRSAKAVAIAESGAKPLYPSAFTVATEGYALSRRLYLYVPVQGVKALALELVEFALSSEGQRLVSASGFVDLTPHAIDTGGCQHCPPKYAALSSRAKRLSLDFRFRSGSAELDSRGHRDLDRLVAFLRESNESRLTLVGFSDTRGGAAQNLKLSFERAKKVAAELSARGVQAVEVEAMGGALAVASNDTDSGRERNRRVEVWLP